jgi:uncharacterized membrane protein
MEYKKGLIGMLILVNLFLSGYLAYIYTTNDRGFCLTGEGCNLVQDSEYSKIFGIQLPWFGLLSFVLLLAVYYLDTKNNIDNRILPTISLIGSIFAMYFLYVQIFIIGALCSTCLVTDLFTILIAVLVLTDFIKNIKD